MVQRDGGVTARVVPDTKALTLMPIVKERVIPKSVIYTDEYPV